MEPEAAFAASKALLQAAMTIDQKQDIPSLVRQYYDVEFQESQVGTSNVFQMYDPHRVVIDLTEIPGRGPTEQELRLDALERALGIEDVPEKTREDLAREWRQGRMSRAEFRKNMALLKKSTRSALDAAVGREDPRVLAQQQEACRQIIQEFQQSHMNVDERYFKKGDGTWHVFRCHEALKEKQYVLRQGRKEGTPLFKIMAERDRKRYMTLYDVSSQTLRMMPISRIRQQLESIRRQGDHLLGNMETVERHAWVEFKELFRKNKGVYPAAL
jgi:hypothetical protein